MQNNYHYNLELSDILERPKNNSSVSTQILFGEKFKILKQHKKFFKIKLINDNYSGYLKKQKFLVNYKPTHKIGKLKSPIFKLSKSRRFTHTKKYLPFASKIEVLKRFKSFVMFNKNLWIKSKDLKPLNHEIKDFSKIVNLFKNIKYKWGGRSFKGIDCSALIQIFYTYNNKFFPRDTIDQVKFKKGIKLKQKFKKGDVIFWKGHVGVCLNSKQIIHAYVPRKKVVVMPIDYTIKLIAKTAKLEIKKVFSI